MHIYTKQRQRYNLFIILTWACGFLIETMLAKPRCGEGSNRRSRSVFNASRWAVAKQVKTQTGQWNVEIQLSPPLLMKVCRGELDLERRQRLKWSAATKEQDSPEVNLIPPPPHHHPPTRTLTENTRIDHISLVAWDLTCNPLRATHAGLNSQSY